MAIWTRITAAIVGLGVGRAASTALEPILEPEKQLAWKQSLSRVLDVGTLAQLVAQGRITEAAARTQAELTGYAADKLAGYIELALTVPALQEVFTAWRRGTLEEADVDHALSKAQIETRYWPALKGLKNVLPSVTDMVRFGVREVYNPPLRAELDLDKEFPEGFATDAANIGLSRDTAKNYWAAHWELPSYTEATQMLFRKAITPEQFSNLLKALDYAPTWRPKLEAIARAIPTMTDFIRFAVREVYSPDIRKEFGLDDNFPEVFAEKAALHGMDREDAKGYWAAHWNLPSTEQGFRMFHRGKIDLRQLKLLLRAKDVMPYWRDHLTEITYLTPGRIDLRRMLAAGVIKRDRVLRGYKDLGYNPEDAEILTDFAVELAKPKKAPGGMTYEEKAEGQLWTAAHRSFLNYEADIQTATEILSLLDITPNEQSAIIGLWENERTLIRGQLTPAQLKKAWRKAVTNEVTGQPWTKEDALAELLSRGWSHLDANTFLDTPTGK